MSMDGSHSAPARVPTASDRLCTIASLAKVGLAACHTTHQPRHLQEALGDVFEVIYDLTGEAVDIVEQREMEIQTAIKATA